MKILEREFDRHKIKTEYKKLVWIYDFWSWLTERKTAKYVIKFAEIQNGERILEVACGTGIVFEKIVKKNPDGQNIGIDLSPTMLKKAEKRMKKAKQSNCKLEEGDVFNLIFKDNEFDLVVNNYMIDLMPLNTFDKIAEEFYRITKAKGIVVVSTFSFGKKKINAFWFWLAKKFPKVLTGCRPVSFKENLLRAGFVIEDSIEISQNTFPSEVIKARKLL